MTERSRFWNGTSTGDAAEAPYDAPTEFAAILQTLVQASQFTARSLVFPRQLNELAPTVGAGAINVASGRALVYGNWYESDGSVAVAIPTPSGATRFDRVVLRKDWSLQTVRLARVAGIEGGITPALTQIAGSIWETSICSVQITTGGTITIALDERNWGFSLVPPTCIVTHSLDQAIPSGPATDIAFNTTWYETDSSMHDASTNNERIVIPKTGLYEVGATLFWGIAATTSYRDMSIFKNGNTDIIARDTRDAFDAIATTTRISQPVSLAAGEYIKLRVMQASGVDINIFGAGYSAYTPRLWARFLQQHMNPVGW